MGKAKHERRAKAIKAKEAKDAQASKRSFLDLPAEFRNAAHEYAVADGLTVVIKSGRLAAKNGLGATCKQVRREFLSILQSEEYEHIPRRFETKVHNLNFRSLLDDMATVKSLALPRVCDKGIMDVTLTFDDKFQNRLASRPTATKALWELGQTSALPREYNFELSGYTHCVGRLRQAMIGGGLEWYRVWGAYSEGLREWKAWVLKVSRHRALGMSSDD